MPNCEDHWESASWSAVNVGGQSPICAPDVHITRRGLYIAAADHSALQTRVNALMVSARWTANATLRERRGNLVFARPTARAHVGGNKVQPYETGAFSTGHPPIMVNADKTTKIPLNQLFKAFDRRYN
jgi:hypothetical protein